MRSNHHLLGRLRTNDGTVYLRSELQRLVGSLDVDRALTPLLERGYLKQINDETFLFNRSPKTALSCRFRQARQSVLMRRKPIRGQRMTSIARFVCELARSKRISFRETYMDRWAQTVTRLSGDEVDSDATDDLLVALTRAGKLSARDMSRLVAAHHRELKRV